MGERFVAQSTSPYSSLISILHRSGYHQSAKNIHRFHPEDRARHQNRDTRTLRPWQPLASVVAFGAKEDSEVNVLRVGGTMSEKGWRFATFQKPAAVHISVTVRTPLHPWRTFF